MEKCCICGHEMEDAADFQRERCTLRRGGMIRYIPKGMTYPPEDMRDFCGLVHFPEVAEKDIDFNSVACVCKKDRCRKRAARWLVGQADAATPTVKRLSFSSTLPAVPQGQQTRKARQDRRRGI